MMSGRQFQCPWQPPARFGANRPNVFRLEKAGVSQDNEPKTILARKLHILLASEFQCHTRPPPCLTRTCCLKTDESKLCLPLLNRKKEASECKCALYIRLGSMRRARSSAECNCSSREVNTFLIFSKLRSASSNMSWTRFSTVEIHLPRNALSSNHSKSIRFRSSDMLRRQQLPDN